jgi:hypothetical protein
MTNRLRIAILLCGMLAGLLATMVSCTTTKAKHFERTTKDSTATATVDSTASRVTKDTATHNGKTSITESSDETYTVTTTDSPVVVYVLDTFYRDRVITKVEKGRVVTNTVYIDSFAKERRRLIEENAALKKRTNVAVVSNTTVKEKAKETKWPWWAWLSILASVGLSCWYWFGNKKAT